MHQCTCKAMCTWRNSAIFFLNKGSSVCRHKANYMKKVAVKAKLNIPAQIAHANQAGLFTLDKWGEKLM